MTAPGLHCCTCAAAVTARGLPGVGSVVVAHRLHGPIARGVSFPRSGMEPMPLALAGMFLSPGLPGESPVRGFFDDNKSDWCEVTPCFEF